MKNPSLPFKYRDNIIAPATPPGTGAISVFRLSGPDVIEITDRFFVPKGKKKLTEAEGHTLHFGELRDGDEVVDEVLVAVFKAPKSYTGENSVEISVHASPYIQKRVLEWFLDHGVRMAEPGEFTLRAFLNRKMDLAQAEAVADLIAAETPWQHRVAMQQLRGGFSKKLKELRDRMVEFAALMELELDFAEEDVEFADRRQFARLLDEIKSTLRELTEGYRTGNAIKEGIPVAITGEPNTGKSTLLNALLNEEKAIVTDIPGTTRDAIEDYIILNGIKYRFIDTAGIREASDRVEQIGIARTFEKIKEARVVLLLVDAARLAADSRLCADTIRRLNEWKKEYPDKIFILTVNKSDLVTPDRLERLLSCFNALKGIHVIHMSAKRKEGVERLKELLSLLAGQGTLKPGDVLVTNARHYRALKEALESVRQVEEGLQAGLSTDLLAVDIRDALNKLGEITGEITTDDLLDHIFQNFCIGK
ncbi:MAG: tRNA uridine-5-carboxymethylaminomethyl(34) synthesis GTPase MnmE [Chlorobi bacterium]|nr:tRNA uridine-5-carboxymethylaminomethyl(34) synthesis GTPase MnmE [Chlorobiota bacterium]